MKTRDKKRFAIGIVVYFAFAATAMILVFYYEYYVKPLHPWVLSNGTIDEIAREANYEIAITSAFTVGAIFAIVALLVVLVFFLWWGVRRLQKNSKRIEELEAEVKSLKSKN
jgi:uncharacterized membrane protein